MKASLLAFPPHAVLSIRQALSLMSHKKDWKRISAPSSLLSFWWPSQSLDSTEVNWARMNWARMNWARKHRAVLAFKMPKQYGCACSHYCGKVDDYKVKCCCFPTVFLGETKTVKCVEMPNKTSQQTQHICALMGVKSYCISLHTFKELNIFFQPYFMQGRLNRFQSTVIIRAFCWKGW